MVPSELPSMFCTFLSKGPVHKEGHAERAVYFGFTPCLYLNESEGVQKSQEQEPRWNFAFSHVLAQHCTALLEKTIQLSRNCTMSKLWFPLNIKKNGKHFHSHNYQHYHLSSHLLLQHLIVVMVGTSLPPFLESGESLCNSAAVICFLLHELRTSSLIKKT